VLSQSLGGCELPCGLQDSLPCHAIARRVTAGLRFVYAVPPSFRFGVTPFSFRSIVGNAVSSAAFHGLANIYARLGSYYWLGFITMGHSADKKRHALYGARLRNAIRAVASVGRELERSERLLTSAATRFASPSCSLNLLAVSRDPKRIAVQTSGH
jgi:hypothetical protein